MADFDRDHLDVIAQLSEWSIADSIRELASQDRLTIALREALRCGASVDELSAICGLRPTEIRRRCNGNLSVLSELESLAS